MCEYVYMGHPLFKTPPYIKMNTNTHIVFVHIYIHIHVDNQKPYILFNLFLYIHIYVKIKRYIIIYIYIFQNAHGTCNRRQHIQRHLIKGNEAIYVKTLSFNKKTCRSSVVVWS